MRKISPFDRSNASHTCDSESASRVVDKNSNISSPFSRAGAEYLFFGLVFTAIRQAPPSPAASPDHRTPHVLMFNCRNSVLPVNHGAVETRFGAILLAPDRFGADDMQENVEPAISRTGNRSIHSLHHHHGWDNSIIPALTIAPGETVSFDMIDASGGQLSAKSTIEAIENWDFKKVNPVTGPVFVDGASPGDALTVTIIDA